MKYYCLLPLALAASTLFAAEGRHLFILSGQSNMARMDPAVSFTPALAQAFGEDNVTVVKDAKGGEPIRRWYKNWKSASGESERAELSGDLYDQLMAKVRPVYETNDFDTVTFLWMQGGRDARESHGEVYEDSLAGLIEQLSDDLGRDDIHVVIGRLSDFDLANTSYPHWTRVREAQLSFVESHPRAAWVDTDDLNDGFDSEGKAIADDLHYSVDGYETFGRRLAKAAIDLIVQAPTGEASDLAGSGRPPNFVVIFTDDLGYGDLGCFGIPYSNDMDTVKGTPSYRDHIDDPNYLAEISYWNVPLMENEDIIERPADQTTLTRRFTEKSINFIRENQDQPFFLYLTHIMPHKPLFAHPDFLGTSKRGLYGDKPSPLGC